MKVATFFLFLFFVVFNSRVKPEIRVFTDTGGRESSSFKQYHTKNESLHFTTSHLTKEAERKNELKLFRKFGTHKTEISSQVTKES